MIHDYDHDDRDHGPPLDPATRNAVLDASQARLSATHAANTGVADTTADPVPDAAGVGAFEDQLARDAAEDVAALDGVTEAKLTVALTLAMVERVRSASAVQVRKDALDLIGDWNRLNLANAKLQDQLATALTELVAERQSRDAAVQLQREAYTQLATVTAERDAARADPRRGNRTGASVESTIERVTLNV